MAVQFDDVNKVLTKIIADWTAGNGVPPNLTEVHGQTFLLDTRDHLVNAHAKGFPLIQPEIIGQKGLGNTANIVVALTSDAGVGGFGRMPFGGLDSNTGKYLDLNSPEVKTIIDWIEGGCQPIAPLANS